MKIYRSREQVQEPVLEKGQVYIYVLENQPQGYIKIGQTHDIVTRLSSLSGSNSGGNVLSRIAVSEPTWLYVLERMSHEKFAANRIDKTEWFANVSFEEAVAYVDSLFVQSCYVTCNQIRKQYFTDRKGATYNGRQSEENMDR